MNHFDTVFIGAIIALIVSVIGVAVLSHIKIKAIAIVCCLYIFVSIILCILAHIYNWPSAILGIGGVETEKTPEEESLSTTDYTYRAETTNNEIPNYTVPERMVSGDVELSYSESVDLLKILIKWNDNTTICDSMIATYDNHAFSESEINDAIETYPTIWRNEGITMQTTPREFVEVGFHPGDLYGKPIYVLILNFNKDYNVDSYSIVEIPGGI